MKLEPICFDVPFEVWYRFEEKLGYDNISVPIQQVSVEDLDYLLINFREMVFKAAGKSDPMIPHVRKFTIDDFAPEGATKLNPIPRQVGRR